MHSPGSLRRARRNFPTGFGTQIVILSARPENMPTRLTPANAPPATPAPSAVASSNTTTILFIFGTPSMRAALIGWQLQVRLQIADQFRWRLTYTGSRGIALPGTGGCGGTGRRPGFRFRCRKAWGFESLHPHQFVGHCLRLPRYTIPFSTAALRRASCHHPSAP